MTDFIERSLRRRGDRFAGGVCQAGVIENSVCQRDHPIGSRLKPTLAATPCFSHLSPPPGERWWHGSPAFFARRNGLMFQEISELRLAQADGGLPTVVAAGSAPGESGIFVFSARFQGGGHVSATPRLHHICFHLTPSAYIDARIAGRARSHKPSRGTLAICPAGADYAADGQGSTEAIIVAIDPGQFALAAAEGSAFEAELIERVSGCDRALFDLARNLAVECADGYPNGPLFWNDMASTFIDGLLVRHTSKFKRLLRGRLDEQVLDRLRDYVVAHMDERIEAGALAKIAGRSPFHFTRVFARSVGMTPYRYVVHLRLKRALELMRDGRHGLAEIAAVTGFADQSHLSRWVRRVHGVSPTELMA
jgi:AraC family transcriptional regulator